jgi:uncharacterized protein (TIGR00255 family)
VAYELNKPLISGFVNAMKLMQREFALEGTPDINVIARLPGAMQPMKDSLSAEMIAGVDAAIDEAITELEQMRSREGESLRIEMLSRVDNIEQRVPVIENAAEGLTDAYRLRLQKRVSELIGRDGQDLQLDAGRLAQEVAYLADRSDISEEIVRLRSHLEQFRETVNTDGETGKRLDFLLQELNREANTVLSKSTDLTIKDAGLAIKGEVEKLREQVQNVE